MKPNGDKLMEVNNVSVLPKKKEKKTEFEKREGIEADKKIRMKKKIKKK